MKKTLVGLHVPALQERYDLLAPVDMQIQELTKLLIDGITELSAGHYMPSELSLLTLKDPDLLLQIDKTLADYGVADGSQLVLF